MSKLTIKYNEETPRLLAKKVRSKKGLQLLVPITANAIFYIYGYFSNNNIWNEGEGFAYKVMLVWGIGAFIFYGTINLYPPINFVIGNGDEDIRHENSLMKVFQYIGLHDRQVRTSFLAGLFGGLNVLIYLGFFTVISR